MTVFRRPRQIFLALLLLVGLRIVAAPLRDFSSETKITKRTKLWTEPTRYGEPMAALEPGVELDVLNYSTTRSWVKVRTPAGREGWVPLRYTSLASKRRLVDAEADEDGARKPASGEAATGNKGLYGEGRVEYANQFSLGTSHGFGVGAVVGYNLNPRWAVGFSLMWNYFKETATGATTRVSRTANHFLFGPNGRFEYKFLSLDMTAGWTLAKTSFSVTDINSGAPLANPSQSEGAFAFSLRPAYRFSLGPKTSLEAYLAYSISFFSSGSLVPGESGSTPQQISLGVAIHTPL